jgi:hypothetical protein
MSDKTIAFRDGAGERSQFMIKAYYSNTAIDFSQELLRPIAPEVTWKQSEAASDKISLNWWPLIDHHPGSNLVMPDDTVEYYIYKTEVLDANLESMCVMNREVQEANKFDTLKTTETTKDLKLQPGVAYKVNVVAQVYQGDYMGQFFIYQ